MSIPFNIDCGCLPRGRLIFIALLSLLGLGHIAHAQTTPAAVPSMKQSLAPALAFRSAFEGYKPYTDDGAPEWKKANDEVGQVGGWRAYAREAQGDVKGEEKRQGQPVQTTRPDPHAGHAKP